MKEFYKFDLQMIGEMSHIFELKGKVYQAILCLCLSLEKMIERVEGR